MNKNLSARLRELKNKGNVQLGNTKSGGGRLRKRSLTRAFHNKLKSQFKRGFTKVVVTSKSWSLTRVVARRTSTIV